MACFDAKKEQIIRIAFQRLDYLQQAMNLLANKNYSYIRMFPAFDI